MGRSEPIPTLTVSVEAFEPYLEPALVRFAASVPKRRFASLGRRKPSRSRSSSATRVCSNGASSRSRSVRRSRPPKHRGASERYYALWLAALETLLAGKGIVSTVVVDAREAAMKEASAANRHGT